jgi:hypothetical protein
MSPTAIAAGVPPLADAAYAKNKESQTPRHDSLSHRSRAAAFAAARYLPNSSNIATDFGFVQRKMRKR